MPVALPTPDRRPLAKAPLVLVVCQVRFDAQDVIHHSELARQWYTEFGGADGPLPKLGQIRTEQVSFDLGEAANVARSAQKGWRLSDRDSVLQLTLLPDSLAVETARFRSWDEFGPIFAKAVELLAVTASPALEERLGLRFINDLSAPNTATAEDWSRYVARELLGLELHRRLGAGIVAAESTFSVELEDDCQSVIRSQRVSRPNGTVGYVLDVDTFRQSSAPFDAAAIVAAADSLNDKSVSIFHELVSDELLGLLREEVDGNPNGSR